MTWKGACVWLGLPLAAAMTMARPAHRRWREHQEMRAAAAEAARELVARAVDPRQPPPHDAHQLARAVSTWLALAATSRSVALSAWAYDADGTPLKGVRIVVSGEDGTSVAGAYSDDEGKATLDVAPGTYMMSCYAPRYLAYVQRDLMVGAGAEVSCVLARDEPPPVYTVDGFAFPADAADRQGW